MRLAAALLVAALAAVNGLLTSSFRLPFPDLGETRVPPDEAVERMTVLSLGLRRLGADLEFIRLLQYYGTLEEGWEAREFTYEQGGGHYPEMLPRTLRLLDLDPYFTPAALFSAGALAFNIGRPDEALEILKYALKRHPEEWRYHSYMAAIGYHKSQNPAEVVRVLEPFVAEADCPTLVKNVVAFLMRRAGQFDKAEKVYRDIQATTDDPGYREIAERSLRALPGERRHWKRPRPPQKKKW